MKSCHGGDSLIAHLFTAALSWSMTLLGSLLFTIALPDTIILAPAYRVGGETERGTDMG